MLSVLDGSRATLSEVVVARRLLLGKSERGLGRLDLRLALLDLSLLDLELSVGAVDVGLRRRRLSLGRGERDAVVAIVDAGDQVARGDMLVVGDRNLGDEARGLGGDGELARRDEGVVGRFEMGGVVPIDLPGRGEQGRGGKADDQSAGPAAGSGLGGLAARLGL